MFVFSLNLQLRQNIGEHNEFSNVDGGKRRVVLQWNFHENAFRFRIFVACIIKILFSVLLTLKSHTTLKDA